MRDSDLSRVYNTYDKEYLLTLFATYHKHPPTPSCSKLIKREYVPYVSESRFLGIISEQSSPSFWSLYIWNNIFTPVCVAGHIKHECVSMSRRGRVDIHTESVGWTVRKAFITN